MLHGCNGASPFCWAHQGRLIIVLLGDQVYCIKCGELNENTPKRYSRPGGRGGWGTGAL